MARVLWFTAGRIGGSLKLRHLTGPQSGQVLLARHSGAEKLDVRNDRLHLGPIVRKWTAIHAAGHAGIDAILNADLAAGTGTILWKIVVEAGQRQSKFLRTGPEVAIAAGQVIACISFRCVGRIGPDIGVGRSDQITAFADLQTM